MAIANPIMNPRLLTGLKTIVFDNDGVIVDSYEANRHYYGMIREELDLPPLTDAEMHFVHTHTHGEAIRHIVPAEKFEQAMEIGENYDVANLKPYYKRSEGLRRFLAFLRSAGFNLAINTSRGDSMYMLIDHLDLENFFHPIITSNKVCVPKPHPEGLHTIMREHGVRPDEVAYIGDSYVDEKCAIAAGVRFWAYKDQALNAEVHIENFLDIKAAMQQCYKGRVLAY